MLVPKSEGRQAIALTFVNSKWSHRAPEDMAVIRVFFGGYARPEVRSMTDADLAVLAHHEVSAMLGATGEPITQEVFRYQDANPQPTVGHQARVERFRNGIADVPGLTVLGAAFDGVGIPDCIKHANAAAKKIATELSSR
jgi:oxygen-dependent protoporphyrinogen oxidase